MEVWREEKYIGKRLELLFLPRSPSFSASSLFSRCTKAPFRVWWKRKPRAKSGNSVQNKGGEHSIRDESRSLFLPETRRRQQGGSTCFILSWNRMDIKTSPWGRCTSSGVRPPQAAETRWNETARFFTPDINKEYIRRGSMIHPSIHPSSYRVDTILIVIITLTHSQLLAWGSFTAPCESVWRKWIYLIKNIWFSSNWPLKHLLLTLITSCTVSL